MVSVSRPFLVSLVFVDRLMAGLIGSEYANRSTSYNSFVLVPWSSNNVRV